MGFLTDILSRTLFRSTFRGIDCLLEDVRAGNPIPKTEPDPKSGALSINGSTLVYASPDYGSWQILISEIAAFGEYTTENGPMIDDWFMVFVTNDFNWVEASNYCSGCDGVRDQLAKHWGAEGLCGSLALSTNFSSRAIWPVTIAGKPLFTFIERHQSTWDKVGSFGVGLIDKDLTPEVRQSLQPIEAK
ncbi:hypothetical protein [Prosthecobacter sp.]|uniref:hypothetical protein n=1 Tax=Prosthecobacter sp. TaxID=1965333 RepID=UPI003784C85F